MKLKSYQLIEQVLRNFHEFETICLQKGTYDIEYANITINFTDFKGAFSALPEIQRKVCNLYLVHDLFQSDVAAELGISTGQVSQHVGRSTREIAAKLFPELVEREIA